MSKLSVVIRIMPGGEDLDVTLPYSSTGDEITRKLLEAKVAPGADGEGNPFVYELVTERDNVRIAAEKSLHDLGVTDGETIFFIPSITAG